MTTREIQIYPAPGQVDWASHPEATAKQVLEYLLEIVKSHPDGETARITSTDGIVRIVATHTLTDAETAAARFDALFNGLQAARGHGLSAAGIEDILAALGRV